MALEPDHRKQNQRTIGEAFKTGTRGEKIFESWLPDDWLIRKQNPDIYIDYVIEVVENGEPTGRQFAVQVKGVNLGENCAPPRKFAAKGSHVRYWLEKCQIPVFLFLVHPAKGAGHWVFVQKFALEQIPQAALPDRKTITLRFDRADTLADKPRFIAQLQEAESYVRDLHPGTIQAALQKTRQMLEQKEPRLTYHISATEGSQLIQLSAKNPFPIKVAIQNPDVNLTQGDFQRAIEHGAELKIPLQHLSFTGSPLFEEWSGAKGEFVMQFGNDVPGNMTFTLPRDSGCHNLQINGIYRVGSKNALFKGALIDAPWNIECDCDLQSDPQRILTSLKMSFPLQRWQGQPILSLAHFETISEAFQKLLSTEGLDTEWFMGNIRIAQGAQNASADEQSQKFLNVLSWFSRCRTVAAHYKINPPFPKLETLTQEHLETVNDLDALIKHGGRRVECPGFVAKCTLTDYPGNSLEPVAHGSIRLEHPNPVFDVIGQPVEVGPIRTTFTDVTLVPDPPISEGMRTVTIRGSDSSIRVIERLNS